MKIVTAAISIRNNKVMIARRKSGQKLEGYWEFPGGKLEGNETLQECLQRELEEEFGCKAKVGENFAESLYEYDDFKIRLIGMYVDLNDAKLELRVHDKIQWVDKTELLSYMLAPADVEIAKQLIQKVLF